MYAPLNAVKRLCVLFGFTVAYAHEQTNILVSALHITFFLFYDTNLNRQDFVYLELVKNHLARCNVCISAI